MLSRKLIAGLGVAALTLACGCRSSTSNYRQPVVVGTAPVAQPVPAAPAPCCNNRPPVAAIPGPPPAGAQVPATMPPGAVGPYGRY
jgi:hypothetical protein